MEIRFNNPGFDLLMFPVDLLCFNDRFALYLAASSMFIINTQRIYKKTLDFTLFPVNFLPCIGTRHVKPSSSPDSVCLVGLTTAGKRAKKKSSHVFL